MPDTTVALRDEATAAQVLKLSEALNDNDDTFERPIQFDIPEDILARLFA